MVNILALNSEPTTIWAGSCFETFLDHNTFDSPIFGHGGHVVLLDGNMSREEIITQINRWRSASPSSYAIVLDLELTLPLTGKHKSLRSNNPNDRNNDKISNITAFKSGDASNGSAPRLGDSVEDDVAAEMEFLLSCMEGGATGYVLSNATAAEIIKALNQVLQGLFYCSPELIAPMLMHLAAYRTIGIMAGRINGDDHSHCNGDDRIWRSTDNASSNRNDGFAEGNENLAEDRANKTITAKAQGDWARTTLPIIKLTAREFEVLQCIAEDHTNEEITKLLVIELATVKHHVHSILEKLNVRNRQQAVRYAVGQGWLKYESL